jgi:hypothetical protein
MSLFGGELLNALIERKKGAYPIKHEVRTAPTAFLASVESQLPSLWKALPRKGFCRNPVALIRRSWTSPQSHR